MTSANPITTSARTPFLIRLAFLRRKDLYEPQYIRVGLKSQQQAQVLFDAVYSVCQFFERRLAVSLQVRISVEIRDHAPVYKGSKGQTPGKHEANPRFRAETQRTILKMVVRHRDAPSRFKYRRDFSREGLRNTKFHFISVANPWPAGHLRAEF